MSMSTQAEFFRGARAAVPVMLGFIPVGLILGATGAQASLSPLGMGLMSGLNYAGGSEFAALALWSAVPPALTVMMTTWLINSRHIMLSAALTPYVNHLPLPRTLLVFFLMCDETWALSMADINRRRHAGFTDAAAFSLAFYLGVALTLWVTWWASAFAGAMIGTGLGDLSVLGFSMAFPAIFICILSGMWQGRARALPWLVSAVTAGLVSLSLGTAWSAALGAVAGLLTVALMPDPSKKTPEPASEETQA